MSASGKQQPSGAIKPSDPKVESVVDTLRDKAGMEPVKKSNDELAGDYGFKSKTPEAKPVKAALMTPKSAAAAPTSPVVSAELPPVEGPAETAPKKVAVRKGAAKREAPPAVVAEDTGVAAPEKTVVRKPRAKKPVAADVAAVNEAATPKKPRAPRKKPDEAAETK